MKYAFLFAFVLIVLTPQPAQALDFFKKKHPQPAETLAPDTVPEKKAAAPKVKLPPFKAFKDPAIGAMREHVATAEDTLVQLSRDYDIGFVEMRAANPDIDPVAFYSGTSAPWPTSAA